MSESDKTSLAVLETAVFSALCVYNANQGNLGWATFTGVLALWAFFVTVVKVVRHG